MTKKLLIVISITILAITILVFTSNTTEDTATDLLTENYTLLSKQYEFLKMRTEETGDESIIRRDENLVKYFTGQGWLNFLEEKHNIYIYHYTEAGFDVSCSDITIEKESTEDDRLYQYSFVLTTTRDDVNESYLVTGSILFILQDGKWFVEEFKQDDVKEQ
jgi:hypothetical protein